MMVLAQRMAMSAMFAQAVSLRMPRALRARSPFMTLSGSILTLSVAVGAFLVITVAGSPNAGGLAVSVTRQTASGPLMHPDSPYWAQTAPSTFRVRIET